MCATDLLARVASEQRGFVRTEQLRWAGLPRRTIDRWREDGRLHRRHRGVLALGHTAPVAFAGEYAALLAIGPDATLSHDGALHVEGVLTATPEIVHVTVPGHDVRSRPGIEVHQSPLPPGSIRVRHGMRLTSPARTLLDLGTVWPARRYSWAVHEVQARRLASLEELRAAATERPWQRGAGRLRAETAGPGFSRSTAERQLTLLLVCAGLPPSETNAYVQGFEVDNWYETERLVVELDSFAFHGTRRAFERDRAKDAELLAAGVRVVRPTWIQVTREPEALVARVRRILARG